MSRQHRAAGFSTREWECLRGDAEDLVRPCVQRLVRQDIAAGRLLGAFLAPPCGSWSSINRSVHRPCSDLWGSLEQPSAAATKSVRRGNACARAALKLISSLEAHRVPWLLEHPRSSKLWRTQEFISLANRSHIEICHLDQCQYGTRWRKATTLMCSHVDPYNLHRLHRRCHKSRSGLCNATGKAHIQLRGLHSSGIPMTSLASSYPRDLAQDISFVLVDEARARFMNHESNI